jgi:uncharacterized protein YidB (DUF937 family)
MGYLDNALPGGSVAKPLILALLAALASGALTKGSAAPGSDAGHPDGAGGGLLGGLGGLLQQFQKSGYGDVINSWIGNGQNQPMSSGQIGSALGPEIIKVLAQKTGLPEQELGQQLSQLLPIVVDKLTPNGRMPTEAEIQRAM